MTEAEEDRLLEQVTADFVREKGLTALHMERWAARPCRPFMDSMTVCRDCGQLFVKVGTSRLHPGDPRLAILKGLHNGNEAEGQVGVPVLR